MPQKEEAKGIGRIVLKGALLALAVTAVLLALAALLVTNGLLPPEKAIAAVFTAEIIGAFIGGRLAARSAETRKLPIAALTGACLFLLLLILGFLFAFPPARHAFLILPAAVIPALLGGFERLNKRKGAHRR